MELELALSGYREPTLDLTPSRKVRNLFRGGPPPSATGTLIKA